MFLAESDRRANLVTIIGKSLDIVRNTKPRGPISPVPLAPRSNSAWGWTSGQRNTRVTQMELAATENVGILFSIVNRITTAVAAAEWHMYRVPRTPLKQVSGSSMDDAREEVFNHAALDVIRNPNPFQTRYEFMEAAQQHIELTGEAWPLIARRPRLPIPAELWLARPDRMECVPSEKTFIAGYTFTTPEGEKVPLNTNEAIQIKTPNPMDPYRGLSPVASLMVDLEASQYAANWNRNFFLNNAQPGGIIQIERRLSDEEFDELTMRWNEQHRGVSKAHRIAILEQGTYVPANYTIKDMAFAELRELNRNTIMEAYGISNSTLGISDGVNYAAAKAADTQFAKLITVPRLERWKHVLNHFFLPMFGSTGSGVMFDYESPVPQDDEAINAERTSKTQAAVAMVQVGFDAGQTLKVLGLPPVKWSKPPSLMPPPAPVIGPGDTKPGAPGHAKSADPDTSHPSKSQD